MKKKNLIRLQDITFGTIAVSSLFLLIGANGAFATTSVVDDVTVTVPASCTMSSTVNSNHTAIVEVGSYVDDIGETTFKVICNDSEGFSVYAVGYTNDEFGNTTMKPSVVADTNVIATGLATSGDTSNWAMKLTAITGDYAPTLETGFNAYHVVPAEYTKVASYSSNTDSSSGSSFKSTYAAYVASAQPADTYIGKVKYTVVHPSNADTPLRKNIDDLTYMQDFNDLSNEDKAAVVLSMKYDTTYNLIDNRDNKAYQVAKLKDDNIWMADNLDLGRTRLTTNLTGVNTNLNDNSSISAAQFNGWIKSSGTQTYTAAELIPVSGTDSTSNTQYGTLYNYCAASAGTICTDSNSNNAANDLCPAGWRLPSGNTTGEIQTLYDMTDYNTAAKMMAPITSGGAAFALAGSFSSSTPVNLGKSGGYWSSTTAEWSGSYSLSLNASSANPALNSYRYYGRSVRCVAKRLFYSVTVSYGTGISDVKIDGKTVQDGETIRLEKNTYQIIAIPSPGYGFSFWSTTAGQVDNTSAQVTDYALNDNTIISTTASYAATEMQNLSQDSCTTTASQVRDIRDNRVYTIQRLKDGKCWMMDNLDLGRTNLTTDLTSSNTNLLTTVTASTFNGWNRPSSYGNEQTGKFVLVDGGDSISGTLYGTIYGYCAASASTICSGYGKNYDNATRDLCPAGWRLPTGGSSGEFQTLYNLTDYNTITKLRASIADGGAAFALAGSFNGATLSGQGSNGEYWSSTRRDNYSMYQLSLFSGSGSVYPANGSSRSDGLAMRCVLKT